MLRTGKRSSTRSAAPAKGDVVRAPTAAPAPGVAAQAAPRALKPEELEDMLRKFDLNPRYGPFVGIDRLERWERADRFGLDPPADIRKHLLAGHAVPQRQGGSLW